MNCLKGSQLEPIILFAKDKNVLNTNSRKITHLRELVVTVCKQGLI